MAELTQDELDWFEDQGWEFYEEDECGGRQLEVTHGKSRKIIRQDLFHRGWYAQSIRDMGTIYHTGHFPTATLAFVQAGLDGWEK